MDSDRTLSPDQFGAWVPSDLRDADFPRPPDWTPKAPIRIVIERRVDDGGPMYRAGRRHRDEDAATADIREAKLVISEVEKSTVILKFQRPQAAYNSKSDTVESRFDREQRALADLQTRLPVELRAMIPRTLDARGNDRTHNEALSLSLPMLVCSAGNCAFALSQDCIQSERALQNRLDELVGRDAVVCEGCNNRRDDESAVGTMSDDCLKRLVMQREELGWRGLIVDHKRLLILTDMGRSLQSHLEELAEHTAAVRQKDIVTDIERILQSMHGLATTLNAVHKLGWMHLDLNLDNICINKNGVLRLIDFGHAEKIDAAVESHHERIPLRRVDFAAPEMQLRSFPLRMRYRGGAEWEGLGLVGWPRGWWPAPGDLIELLDGVSEAPLLKIRETEPKRGILRIVADAVASPELSAKHLEGCNEEVFDAKIHRLPQPSADLYSFGLVMLCLLTRTLRPVLYRNELSVFERAIAPTTNQLTDSQIGDENWRHVYRRVFGRYSVLMDETFGWWSELLQNANGEGLKRDYYEYAFREAIRIAVKCVIRHPIWSYAAIRAERNRSFSLVDQDFTRLLEGLHHEIIPIDVRHPLSFDQFHTWLVRETANTLEPPVRLQIRQALDRILVAFDLWRVAETKIAEIEGRIVSLREELRTIEIRLERLRPYMEGYQRLPLIRHFWLTFKDFFSRSRKDFAPDAKMVEIVETIKNLNEIAAKSGSWDWSRLETLTIQLPEFDQYLEHPQYTPSEYRRVRIIEDSIRSTLAEMRQFGDRLSSGDSQFHQQRAGGIRVIFENGQWLSQFLEETTQEFRKRKTRWERSLPDKLQQTLDEMRVPATKLAECHKREYELFIERIVSVQRSAVNLTNLVSPSEDSLVSPPSVRAVRADLERLKTLFQQLPTKKEA